MYAYSVCLFQAIVVLKYLFQFYFFPWNNHDPPQNNPFYPTIILGIRKDDNYAGYDLAVLLVVFFHRFMLKVRKIMFLKKFAQLRMLFGGSLFTSDIIIVI